MPILVVIGILVGLYFAKLGLGSPTKDYYVQVDTGSYILWVNCVGCKSCPKKTGLGLTMKTLSLDLPTSIRGQWMVPRIQRLPWEPINHSTYPLGSQSGDKSMASGWHCGTST
ncbi:hypothetical protein ACJW30_01G180600 [Castanea mollissima]